MDLINRGWSKETPPEIKEKYDTDRNLHYNWTGWRYITNLLEGFGVDMTQFSGSNDGDLLSQNTCKSVAKALEDHWQELSEDDQAWLTDHLPKWKWSRGFEQW